MRRFLAASMLVAAVLGAVTSVASPMADASTLPRSAPDNGAQGTFSLRLYEVPIDLASDPRAQVSIIDDVKPGTTIKRRVVATNNTDSVLRLAFYSDAATIANGSFIGATGRAQSELSSWTTMSDGTLEIPPGGTAFDTVTVAVPADAAPGERYAAIWAADTGSGGGNITRVNRVGVRIYLSVSSGNPPEPDFAVDTVTAQRDAQDRPVVAAMVHNTGGRALDMSGTLTLSTVTGGLHSVAGPYLARLGTTLAPGQSEPVTISVTDQLADGPWDATIELKSGLLDKTYQARITFPHSPGSLPPVAAHQKTAGGHLMLIVGGGLTAAALLGATTYPIARSRRRRIKNLNRL